MSARTGQTGQPGKPGRAGDASSSGGPARPPTPTPSPSPTLSPTPSPSPSGLLESLLAFFVAVALTAILFQVSRFVPFVAQNLAAFVAVGFIYIPVWSARRRGLDLSAYGFTTRPHRRTLAFALGGPTIVFPLFLVGFVLFYQWACAGSALTALAPRAWCHVFTGWSGLEHPRAPASFLWTALNQVVVVALPEELFFRGFLLSRLETAFPPRHRLLGGGIGVALVLSAALFAVGHVVSGLDPGRLATFFPGLLFGWMRSATGNIAAGTFVHAASNLYIEALHRTFFA